MYNNLKILCISAFYFSSCCFGTGLDPFTNQENNKQENIEQNYKSDYHLNSFSEKTSIDKDGNVVYDSVEKSSDNGKEMEPRKRHFEGNREEFNKFRENVEKENWKPSLKFRHIAPSPRDLPNQNVATNEVSPRLADDSNIRPERGVPARVARKAFKKFIARVAVLIQKTLDELRMEKAKELALDNEMKIKRKSSPEGDHIIISNNDDNLESFDNIDEFIQRAFSEYGYTTVNRHPKHVNGKHYFGKFLRQVHEIANQTMREFGIKSHDIERR